jgi:hypothetical protein
MKCRAIHIRDILPENLKLKNNLFKDITNSANTARQKYGDYFLANSVTLEMLEVYFYLIKNACDNKKMIIKNPRYLECNQSKIISSDTCFITHYEKDDDDDLIFNYYFEKENIVLGIFSGSGNLGLSISAAYLIYLTDLTCFIFEGSQSLLVVKNSTYFLPKIQEVVKNIDLEKIKLEPSLIRTLEGYNYGLFHTCCTFVNGIYIMDQIGINNNIDEIIIGPNDPFLIENYYKKKYKNINIVKGKLLNSEFDPHTIYKGVIFKYGHYHVLNKCAEFIKTYIRDVMPVCKEYINEIEHIKKNYYPVISVNLRCLTCEIKDQPNVIGEVVNKIKSVYPKSYFLIGGFIGDYNEELIDKTNIKFATYCTGYSQNLKAYKNTFETLITHINHNDFNSLINLKINNVLAYTSIVDFSINMNAGYTVVETILHDIPSIFFGTKWIYHCKKINYVSKENYKEPNYIENKNEITFYNNNPTCDADIYLPITCEINADSIVSKVVDYFKNK